MKKLELNLQLFGEGDGGDADGGVATADDNAQLVNEPESTQEQETPEEDFESLIEGKYKDDFNKRVKGIIDKRLGDRKSLEKSLNDSRDLISLVAERYGVQDPADIQSLRSAIENDKKFYEDEAMEKGIDVQTLMDMKRVERENSRLRAMAEQQQQENERNQFFADLQRQAAELQQIYPNFTLEEESDNEQFVDLVQNGVPVRTAYEVIHKDDIISGAMQFAAQEASRKVVNDIRAKGNRPVENGAKGQQGVETKLDVTKMTAKERAELEKRALRGEKITL